MACSRDLMEAGVPVDLCGDYDSRILHFEAREKNRGWTLPLGGITGNRSRAAMSRERRAESPDPDRWGGKAP